ncbi:MAG: hypothetical protein HUU16_18750 [Candidatus Omnitrophica bacterium]|nr:hypothetical protein [Candidatus Omnitrophota bacterium]
MLDVNTTFGSRPAGWSMLNVLFQNNPVGDLAFTPSDLLPMRSDILRNIPLDPAEDNDNNPNTFPLPDGIDNDDDGLTDEGVNNTLDFDLSRYTTLSGVAIFRDMPNSDRNGLFDDPLDPNVRVPDLPVFLSGEENFAFPIGTEAYISLALDHDPVDINAPGKGDPIDPAPFETVPTNDNGANRGSDYFLVIRTSKSISQGDDFQVRLTTHGTVIHTNDGGTVGIVVGTSFGFMPGATTGLGPIFPERQPYSYDPLRNARLVPSLAPVAEEPLSPGNLRIPGISAFDTDPPDPRLRFLGIDFTHELFPIRSPFNLYEAYKPFLSNVYVNTEDGDDLPNLQFLLPTFDETIGTDLDIDPGTVFLRWADIDEDSPDAEVTLVYFPVLIDPMFGELFPLTPTDPRFTFTVIRGVSRGLDPNSDIDDFTIVPYQDQLLITDNENVVGGLGTDIFTWDARLVPPGLYRIAAFLNDFSNPPVVVVGGRILIENQRPELILTQP